MEGEDAVGGEVFFVERDGLGSEQVQRDGVAGEGVDGEDVELLRSFASKRGAGVAFGEGDLRSRVAEVGEEVLRDGEDERVDLVEADAVARAAVGGERAGAEADDADVARDGRRSRSAEPGRCRN